MSNVFPGDKLPEPLSSVRVTQVGVTTNGPLRRSNREPLRTRWSSTSLGFGIAGLLLVPAFGVGIIPAILAIIIGHVAKNLEPQGLAKSAIGRGLGYVGLVVGTAVLVFVAIPLLLAFLVSTGYILTD